jgi:hypothetical protein
MTKSTHIIFLLVLFIFASCKTLTTSNGEKIKPFKGTIIYDVQVVQLVDTTYVRDKTDFFGDQMHLTVFRNGDIQRKFFNASRLGYDLTYLDIKNKLDVTKYNHSDTLYEKSSNSSNMTKVKGIPLSMTTEKILSYDLTEIAIGAKEIATPSVKGDFLSIRYWHTDEYKVDKLVYSKVNRDLWSYFMTNSDGSLCLKYEIDYFTYKVTYTAIEILPGKYEKYKEKMSADSPRVIK